MNPSTHKIDPIVVGQQGLIKVHRRAYPEFWQRIEVNPHGAGTVLNLQGNTGTITLPLAIDRLLARRKKIGHENVLIGGPSEPYPLREKQKRLTRITLEVIAKHGYPVTIVTSSTLVLRDIDILREMNESSMVTIAFCLPSTNLKALRQAKKPTAKLTESLFCLERISRTGIQTGVAVWPLHFNGNVKSGTMFGLFRVAREIGLDFVMFPHGRNPLYKRWENNNIASNFPRRVSQEILELSQEYKIRIRPKRFIPNDKRKENFWLAGKLADEAYRLSLLGKPFSAFISAANTINHLKQDIRLLVTYEGLQALPKLPSATHEMVVSYLQGNWADSFDERLEP